MAPKIKDKACGMTERRQPAVERATREVSSSDSQVLLRQEVKGELVTNRKFQRK